MTDYTTAYQILMVKFGAITADKAMREAQRHCHALVTGTHCHVNKISSDMYVIVGIEA